MSNTEQLLEATCTALDPERFLEQLNQSEDGRSFLIGDSDSVILTRGFLESEIAIAQRGLDALERIRRLLAGT